MSKAKDKDSGKNSPVPGDGVRYDAHGKAVWQRVVDSGRHLIESTSRLLKRLDVPGLKLEDEVREQEKTPALKPGEKKPELRGSAGYDPYGHNRVTARAAAPLSAKKPVATPRPRRSWWQRLFRRD